MRAGNGKSRKRMGSYCGGASFGPHGRSSVLEPTFMAMAAVLLVRPKLTKARCNILRGGDWHWKCDLCGCAATTRRTRAMVREKKGPGIPQGWSDLPRRVGLICSGCISKDKKYIRLVEP
jgi:hypothetical protein